MSSRRFLEGTVTGGHAATRAVALAMTWRMVEKSSLERVWMCWLGRRVLVMMDWDMKL